MVYSKPVAGASDIINGLFVSPINYPGGLIRYPERPASAHGCRESVFPILHAPGPGKDPGARDNGRFSRAWLEGKDMGSAGRSGGHFGHDHLSDTRSAHDRRWDRSDRRRLAELAPSGGTRRARCAHGQRSTRSVFSPGSRSGIGSRSEQGKATCGYSRSEKGPGPEKKSGQGIEKTSAKESRKTCGQGSRGNEEKTRKNHNKTHEDT